MQYAPNELYERLQWSSDGRSLAWESDEGAVTVASLHGSRPRTILRDQTYGFAWLGADRVVCACRTGLISIRADGADRRQLAQGAVAFPSVSSDGTEIAFGRRCAAYAHRETYCEIAVIRPDGSGERTVVPHRAGELSGPSDYALWIPGTHRLLVNYWGTAAAAVERVAVDSGVRTVLRPSVSVPGNEVLAVSPDGGFVFATGSRIDLCSPSGAVLQRFVARVAAATG